MGKVVEWKPQEIMHRRIYRTQGIPPTQQKFLNFHAVFGKIG